MRNLGGFDAVVASTDPAMVVVTVAVGAERDGCLVGFHSQSSIDPPRYAVWLSRANRTFELAQRASHLAVHLLGAADHDLAALFGGRSGDVVDKLASCEWEAGLGDVPLLARCPSRFVGRIVDRHDDGGDHVAHILEPLAAESGMSSPPLRLGAVTDIEPGHEAGERR